MTLFSINSIGNQHQNTWQNTPGNAHDVRAVMKAIVKINHRNNINQSLLQKRPAKKYTFIPKLPSLDARSVSGAFVSLLLGTSLTQQMMGNRSVAPLRFRRQADSTSVSNAPLDLTSNQTSAAMLPIAEPTDIATPNIDAPEPSNATRPDWFKAIDQSIFEKVNLGPAQIDARDHIGQLNQIYRWWTRNPLPLDITQFDRTKLEQFATSVMAAIGYDGQAKGLTDPAFLQYLFTNYFSHHAAPTMLTPNGNTLFNQTLLGLIRPNTQQQASSCNAIDNASLLNINALKNALETTYLQIHIGQNVTTQQIPMLRWVFDGWCQIAEPTLIRRDLPENIGYGSLAWTLLSIGIELAGDMHTDLSHNNLIALAVSSDIFSNTTENAANAEQLAAQQTAMRLIVRMAHAHGKLNLLQPGGITHTDAEVALGFFNQELSIAIKNMAPLTQLMQRLPMRSQIAKTMLKEAHFDAVEQCFRTGIRPYQVFTNVRNLPSLCTPVGATHQMHEVLMMDCIGRNEFGDALSKQQKQQLRVPSLTYAELNRRFEEQFNAELTPLNREVMLPILTSGIKKMGPDESPFWHLGVWTVRVPKAELQARTPSSQYVGAYQAGESHTKYGRYTMQGVLVQLVHEGASRSYWATLEPFELHRYNETDVALLESHALDFFKPNTKDKNPSIAPYTLKYTDYKNGNEHGDLLQTIAALLVHHRIPDLLHYAREVTKSEKSRERKREFLLDLIPLRSCIKSLQSSQHGMAKLYCGLDAISFIPGIVAGAKLGKVGIGIGQRMSTADMRNIARAFMRHPLTAAGASKTAPIVLNIGQSSLHLTAEAIRLIDPGIELSYRLSAGLFRISAASIKRLAHKIDGIDPLLPLATRLQQAGRERSYYFDHGLWRAHPNPDTRIMIGDQAYAKFEHQAYPVFTVGNRDNVLTIKDGNSFRLLNPNSRLGYGPLLRQGNSAGQLVPVMSSTNALGATRTRLPTVLCRAKRAHGRLPTCVTLDPQYGIPFVYRRTDLIAERVYQLTVVSPIAARPPSRHFLVDTGQSFSISAFYPATRQITHDVVRHLSDHDVSFDPPSPSTFNAQIGTHINADGNLINYLKWPTKTTNQRGEEFTKTYYMPFGTYEGMAFDPIEWINFPIQDIKTEVWGFVFLNPADPNSAYRFRIDKSRIPIRRENLMSIRLEQASPADIAKYRRFQERITINHADYNAAVTHAVKLQNAAPALQNRFSVVFQRAQVILDQAHEVFTIDPGLTRTICKKILNLPFSIENIHKVNRVVDAAKEQVILMRRLMPEWQRQSPNFIGFFNDVSHSPTRAVSFTFSLLGQPDLSSIENPLVLFEKNYFMRDDVAFDNHAANLIHEFSHAISGTNDAMIPHGPSVYANSNDINHFTMTPISAAAAHANSVPENHAPTLEHLIVLAAYRKDKNKHMLPVFLSDAQAPDRIFYARYWKFGQGNDGKAGPNGIPLCRTKRSADALTPCHLPLVRDARFGVNVFSRQHVPEKAAFQLRVTAPSTVKINLRDVGFKTWRINAQRYWEPQNATLSERYDPATDSWQEHLDLIAQFGAPSQARIVRVANTSRNPQSEYALLAFSDGRIRHARYLPFSSYQDGNSDVVGVIEIGSHHYCFRTNGTSIQNDSVVQLNQANQDEKNKLQKYQDLLNYRWAPSIAGSIVKLSSRSPHFQNRFRMLLNNAEQILEDAITTIERQPALFHTICQRFASATYDADAVLSTTDKKLRDMQRNFAYFKAQCENFIGFYNASSIAARAIPNAIEYQLDFSRANQTLINFNLKNFGDSMSIDNNHAALLLSNYARALLGADDQIKVPNTKFVESIELAKLSQFYDDGAGYDAKPLITAIKQSGNHPTHYAVTLELMAMILADAWTKQRYLHFLTSENRNITQQRAN